MLDVRVCLVVCAVALLAACNGKEDFSDAVIGGPVIDSTLPDPNFDPANPCAPRVIGLLEVGETVKNIGYTCGGYFGYTGSDRFLPSEQEQNFFVCPLRSREITFFIGGRANVGSPMRADLGTAAFRVARSKQVDNQGNPIACEADIEPVTGEPLYLNGSRYDADGPYLFTTADLVSPPVRVDGVSDTVGSAPNENRNQVLNTAALLMALDTDTSGDVLAVSEEAHALLYDSITTFTPDFSLDYPDFTAASGEVDEFISQIVPPPSGALPATQADVKARVEDANNATAAGLYRMEFRTDEYGLGFFTEQASINPNNPPAETIFKDTVLLTDLLPFRIDYAGSRAPGDTFLLLSRDEFWPFTVIDRRGRIIGGGAFDVGTFGGDAADYDRVCQPVGSTIGEPLFMTMDPGTISLSPDLTLNNFVYLPATTGGAGDVTLTGRFIEGYALSGVTLDGVAASKSDFDTLYPNVGYEFNAATDSSRVASTICGKTITGQTTLGYTRQGVVVPSLDEELMTALFATPAQYTLYYHSRADIDDDDFTNVSPGQAVTIHADGTILTDNNPDGNSDYDNNAVIPADEHLVGMVSSVFPGVDDPLTAPDERLTEATANLLVFNFVGPADINDIVRFGSHFRARLVPDTACSGDNSLFEASDFGVEEENPAYWYDPYRVTDWYRNNPNPTDEQQFDNVVPLAYGEIKATRTGCP